MLKGVNVERAVSIKWVKTFMSIPRTNFRKKHVTFFMVELFLKPLFMTKM